MNRVSRSLVWGPPVHVFSPADATGRAARWMRTHAQVPTPIAVDGVLRVYFAARPERTLSLTGFVDLDPGDPSRVLYVHPDPILQPGPPGSFDEHGLMPSCALHVGDEVWLYYSGWSRSVGVPYTNLTGLAVSCDGGRTFRRACPGPVINSGPYDPYSATSALVTADARGYLAYYSSGTDWLEIDGRQEHVYDLKEANSADGVLWEQGGRSILERKSGDEALVRPAVWCDGGCRRMLFSYRRSRDFRGGAGSYRIGLATSTDGGRTWVRDDEASGIRPSASGWNSEMNAYPAVIRHNERLLLFFNGRQFGLDGFGYRQGPATQRSGRDHVVPPHDVKPL